MLKKQTTRRFKRIWTATIHLILLLSLAGSGERRIERHSTPKTVRTSSGVLNLSRVSVLEDEPRVLKTVSKPRSVVSAAVAKSVHKVATPTAIEPTPTPEPIPIAAIAGQANLMRTAKLTPTAATIETIKPPPTYISTPMPFQSAPPRLSPTRLVIPTIGLDAPIVASRRVNFNINGQSVTTWGVPDTYAAGWHYTSALPGEVGNMVLNGHSNVHGEVFRYLEALEQDDQIIIYVGNAAYHYRVADKHLLQEEGLSWEVRTKNIQFTMPTEDERLTFVTCAPYPETTHRLIVVALPTDSKSPYATVAQ